MKSKENFHCSRYIELYLTTTEHDTARLLRRKKQLRKSKVLKVIRTGLFWLQGLALIVHMTPSKGRNHFVGRGGKYFQVYHHFLHCLWDWDFWSLCDFCVLEQKWTRKSNHWSKFPFWVGTFCSYNLFDARYCLFQLCFRKLHFRFLCKRCTTEWNYIRLTFTGIDILL